MLSLAVITTKKNSLSFQCLQGTILYVKTANITVRKKTLPAWKSFEGSRSDVRYLITLPFKSPVLPLFHRKWMTYQSTSSTLSLPVGSDYQEPSCQITP